MASTSPRRRASTSSRSCCSGALCMATIALAMFWSPVSLLERWTSREYLVHSPDDTQGAVFITGCSSGIGRHAALALAKEGYTVFATVRKEVDAMILLDEWDKRTEASPSSDGALHPIACEVTDASQIQAAREKVETWINSTPEGKKRRVLIGIVNNAGVTSELELLDRVSVESLEYVWNVNLKGPFLVYQTFLPLLRSNKIRSSVAGRIINVGSISGQAARPFRGTYIISKFALEGLSDTQRQELLLENISVSMVNPGYIQTDLSVKTMAMTRAKFGDPSERMDLTALQQEMLQNFELNYAKAFATAATPEETTWAIRDALLNPRPKTRYFPGSMGVGKIPAWVFPKLKILVPDRILDQLVLKAISSSQPKTSSCGCCADP
jgi:NAD(P)-dependent dehydrogenase (short-subunit alcohol dehydrogenase family)